VLFRKIGQVCRRAANNTEHPTLLTGRMDAEMVLPVFGEVAWHPQLLTRAPLIEANWLAE